MPNRKTALLVDDDREILAATTLRLEFAGFRTVTACDGDAGVDLAVEHHPHVIVLDVQMPRKNGIDTLRELKGRPETKDIPVVMLTVSITQQAEALDAGARFYLRKPYRGDVLVRTIAAAASVPPSA